MKEEDTLVLLRKDKRILTYRMQNDSLITVQAQPEEEDGFLGNIYVGKIQNIVTNIYAAFVEIQKGVICYLPMEEAKQPLVLNRIFTGKLQIGDELLVQVVRDRIKTKEAVVTALLSISGKYAVVSYPNQKIGLSVQLNREEKKALLEKCTPFFKAGLGYIIRTNAAVFAAQDADLTALKEELSQLSDEMRALCAAAKSRVAFSLLYQAPAQFLSVLKNTDMQALQKIITDDVHLFAQAKEYLNHYQPEDAGKLVLYRDEVICLEKLLRLESRLSEAVSKKVWLKSGGYLVIEPTEALTVIDVNTGKYLSKKDRETTFLTINLEAAAEIAHQIRLRNLSGIIVIDFINLQADANQEKLMRYLKNCVKADPIKTVVVDITPLGLIEVTRKKTEASLQEQLSR